MDLSKGMEVNDILTAYDTSNQILYIQIGSKLIEIDVKENSTKITNDVDEIGGCGRGVIMDNTLHVAGGYRNKCHLIWDFTQNKYEKMHEFDVLKSMAHPGFVYIESRDIMLLFGGYDHDVTKDDYYDLDDIYLYDIDNKQWKLLSLKLPKPLSNFGCVF